MTELTRERHRPLGRMAERFNELLRNYPHLDKGDVDDMIAIYPRLTILEMGLLSTDKLLSNRFDAFMRDHAGRLRSSWRDSLIFVLVLLGTVALMGALVWAAMR
jgi:hypothetical protein